MRSVLIRLFLALTLSLSATSLAPLASAAVAESTSGQSLRAAAPSVKIYGHPRKVTIFAKAHFSYGSDTAGVAFRCRLRGPGRWHHTFHPCPSDSPGSKTGRVTYTGLKAGRGKYRFVVQSYVPATAADPEDAGALAWFGWHRYSITSGPRYLPRRGATFNRPLGPTHQLTNINKMIRTIDAMPGYKQGSDATCPWAPRLRPSSIRVTLYSLTGKRFATALIKAHRRCISVQVLMNNHLDRNTDPAWKRLEDALGTKVYGGSRARRSFAHRCSYGCRGSGVLHTKMYLFDSSTQRARYNRINSMVSMGSANMTFNSTNIQYNDLYTVRSRPDIYRTYLRVFNLMKRDNGVHRRLIQVRNGAFRSTFWPQDRGGADPQMTMLRSIKCRGATGGTGLNGRTVVYINMHAWFNARGLRFAKRVRQMYRQGCYIHVLYGFMSYGVFKQLRNGTGKRITVRRTLFSRNGHTGYVYSHMKNVAVSGHVGSDHSAKVVWTGSNNFTNGGTHYDEVMMRIPLASAYRAYRKQFQYISNRLSSSKYAIFQEPEGGGRAPRTMLPRAIDVPEDEAYDLPPGTPVITSPDVVFDKFGEPKALD